MTATAASDRSVWALAARFRELGILVFLAIVVVGVSLKAPRFLQASNLRDILLDMPLLLVVAMGMTMVIISRNIDLSVGAALGVSGMVVGAAFKANPNLPIPVGLLLGMLVGFGLGSFNGLLVTWLRVPAIIATLGTLSVFRGLVFVVSGGSQIDRAHIPADLVALSQSSPLGPPMLVLMAFGICLAFHLFLRYHRVGRNIYAIGGNPDAARLCGIRVGPTVWMVFAVTGALAGLAGVMYAARFGFINPAQTGVGFELSVIAATVIGGTDVFGGSGSVLGTVLGCLLLATLNNALTVMGLSAFWQLAVYGTIILLAVWTDSTIRSKLGQLAQETAY